ncbi:MAG: hypothetical protein HQL31_09470, partial [Planctomycetes bacterium]|nr:hypothetical protein [Planctomycetota bacterium]
WSRIPHFYYNYYVFQYATGIAAAIALARRIIGGGTGERSDYLRFLALGCREDPLDALTLAGADLSRAETIEAVILHMDRLIDEFEETAGQCLHHGLQD